MRIQFILNPYYIEQKELCSMLEAKPSTNQTREQFNGNALDARNIGPMPVWLQNLDNNKF